jgi:hypothetical protein
MVNAPDAVPPLLLERSWERAAARAIEARFPGVHAWHGRATGSWWAFLPGGAGRLVEAVNPEELTEIIKASRLLAS